MNRNYGTAVKRHPDWSGFAYAFTLKFTHAQWIDVLTVNCADAGQADIIFGTWQVGT